MSNALYEIADALYDITVVWQINTVTIGIWSALWVILIFDIFYSNCEILCVFGVAR